VTRPSIDLTALRRRLGARTPSRVFRWLPARRAAVAVILDEDRRVLLTERAARAGDRWSAHVSLPGGMQQEGDGSLLATAARETLEEVGVDVMGMDPLGALDEVRAIANGGLRPMSIAPFVFVARGPVTPALGPEVASVFWLPLDLASAGALDERLLHPVARVPLTFACWRFEGHTIWGLTHGVLQSMLRLMR
jgi:8-oxo-dGTP pyrophosphatase MutT (NUDIX family)